MGASCLLLTGDDLPAGVPVGTSVGTIRVNGSIWGKWLPSYRTAVVPTVVVVAGSTTMGSRSPELILV